MRQFFKLFYPYLHILKVSSAKVKSSACEILSRFYGYLLCKFLEMA
jgi:hypothetical protein